MRSGKPSAHLAALVILTTPLMAQVAKVEDLFPTFSDGDTVTLLLFDESDYPHTTLTDASPYEKADLCLMDGEMVDHGRFGRALRARDGHAVSFAGFAGKFPEEEIREEDGTPSGLWGPTETPAALIEGLAGDAWTVELWLNVPSARGATIIDLGQAYTPGFSLSLGGGAFEIINSYAGLKAVCPSGRLSDGWHHVAFTRSGGVVRHYLDGRKQKRCSVSSVGRQALPPIRRIEDREHGNHEDARFDGMDHERRRRNRFNFAVGTDRRGAGSINGMVDELRISRVVRHTRGFAPVSFSRNHGPAAPGPSKPNGPPLLFPPGRGVGPRSSPAGGSGAGTLDFGMRKHVFIDGAILSEMSGLRITMNRPYGKQPIRGVKVRKSRWRPSVYEVDDTVFMAIPTGYGSEQGETYLATAKDGLNFTMQDNMIEGVPMYGAFFKDLNPGVRDEELYKINAFLANRGMYFYVSPDGKNWRRNETIQLPLRSGGGGECFWDDQRGRYASYIKRDSSFHNEEAPRPRPRGRTAIGFWTPEILKAWPFGKMRQPYFEGYPFPSVSGEGPISFAVTDATEAYRTRAIKYPWAPDVYLAFVWRYPGNDKGDPPRHVDLGVSRDGDNWTFFGRDWYIPKGDAQEELSIYGLIRRGDEIWQYVDEGGAHGGDRGRHYYRYIQRLDGFVSLDTAGRTGTAVTRPLTFNGQAAELALNVRTGSTRVAILGKGGQAIAGFGLGDCAPVAADAVDHVLTWNGKSDIGSLSGREIRLKFEMGEGTKLYAFQFRSKR